MEFASFSLIKALTHCKSYLLRQRSSSYFLGKFHHRYLMRLLRTAVHHQAHQGRQETDLADVLIHHRNQLATPHQCSSTIVIRLQVSD